MSQEYIQQTDPFVFQKKLDEAIAQGGRVKAMNTALLAANYSYTGGNQCRTIDYVNVYWALVEFPNRQVRQMSDQEFDAELESLK